MRSSHTPAFGRSRWAHTLGYALLALLVLATHGYESHARLEPYYVLRGLGPGDIRPRILFVLDTSGSMSWRATESNQQCAWADCEAGNEGTESRIAAARRIIHRVVASTADEASFALMTFDQYDPPTSVPARCSNNARFTWVTEYRAFSWAQIWTDADIGGYWRLCQGGQQRPYPYLRWDELGENSEIGSNGLDGPVPPSPLIGAQPGLAANAHRRVQWFPQFMGTRARLDTDTDPDHALLDATYGDYGATDETRSAQVWGHDFYYWPYVDGFPHYASHAVRPYNWGRDRGGVTGQDSNVSEAKLHAPFFLDLDESGIPPEAWGPPSQEDATATVLAKTAPLIEGGVDASGGTPWLSVVGDSSTTVDTNAAGGHRSIASYLKFLEAQTTEDVCAPTIVVLITDGVPSPSSEGGAPLYERLAALRSEFGAKTYVVGFFQNSGEINNMACAAAGACDGSTCSSPCDDTPTRDWDTCRERGNPSACAHLADSSDALAQVLTNIVTSELSLELSAGPSTTANEFGVGADGTPGQGTAIQTRLEANTDWPGWRGHVTRTLCDERDGGGELLEHCRLPSPQWQPGELAPTFGPCPQSREWDAGDCLARTPWDSRRIYTSTESGEAIRVADEDGRATPEFVAELHRQNLLSSADPDTEADDLAAFILGRDWPDGWKLPGLASSTPTLIRRVPPLRTEVAPSVSIRNPHCAGRRFPSAGGDLPSSLEDFARENANDPTLGPEGAFEYQEAVLIGDDMGVLHAFQYDSGNELWGFIPNALLPTTVAHAERGPPTSGTPNSLDEHIYGISASVNAGYVFDDTSERVEEHQWRHLAVFGFGPGGSDYVALDVKHMSPASPQGPVEVLWATSQPGLAPAYDGLLGETWSRPALTYHVPDDDMSREPKAFLVVGSGYGEPGPRGRSLLQIDAVSGQLLKQVDVGEATEATFANAFGLVSDPSVATHCASRFWAEAQETYVADPSGRLFRWDLGRETNHEADSGGTWEGTASPALQFQACVGSGSTCVVASNNPGEPFSFAPAVTSNDRIDDSASGDASAGEAGKDHLLVALVSGAHHDASSSVNESAFHSSLYLLVDDHRDAPSEGFNVPAGAPKMTVGEVGTNANYLRIALSDIERTRTFVPYPEAERITETRNFLPATRPTRSPRIVMRGVVDNSGEQPEVVDGVEVAEITYFVHEPPVQACDPRFYDPQTGIWHVDAGSAFEIRLRLSVDTVSGFDFAEGAEASSVEFADPSFERGLAFVGVEQAGGEACPDGVCSPQPAATPLQPCDNNVDTPPVVGPHFAVPLVAREFRSFSPVE